jgi:branched-chain amino acid transport system ATP-binding protein
MFKCTNLTVERSGQRVLDAIHLQLKPGEILGLIGPNGCGKSTLLEALVGEIPIAGGQILIDGHSLETEPTHVRARRGVRLVPDRNLVFANLSVQDHLSLHTDAGASSLDLNAFARFRPSQKAGSLSGGEKRILATVSALASRPRLLLADEFSEGLQPSVVQRMLQEVRALCKEGAMAILVIHSERFAAQEGVPALTIQQRSIMRIGPQAG